MAAELAATVPKAKELFDRASEIVGYDLLQVCAEGGWVGGWVGGGAQGACGSSSALRPPRLVPSC